MSRADAMGVVAKGLVEGGSFADRSLDRDGSVRVVSGEQVGVDRGEHHGRGVWVQAQDRLTSNDDDVVVVGEVGAGADQVLEMLAAHGP